MSGVITIREHEGFGKQLTRQDVAELKPLVPTVLKDKGGELAAGSHVGIITTRRGLVCEILPKIDLGGETDPGHEKTRRAFLRMLRCWRGFNKSLPESGIRAMRHFPMLDIFVRQFLISVNALARSGLARRYIPIEENLPCLRGRLLFREQLRTNHSNAARFFVAHDVLSVNRPANRLIRTALARLAPAIRSDENTRLLQRAHAAFENVPATVNPQADWERHHVDRCMRLYAPVMRWVGLFLFNHGLTTFSGKHTNISLLFPMEKVFENFVAHSFSRFQQRYRVAVQHPQEKLATINGKGAFTTKPDIALKDGGRVRFILDTKWKNIEGFGDDAKHGIDQADMYQLYAYGKLHRCDAVALVYPRSDQFRSQLRYRFFDGLELICLPFDVTRPQESVDLCLQSLEECAGR
ncbi:MAG: hypothetical protein OXF74_09510 [Rhodobacteraceae bacterium]|nr:hypothetical protein [Paracoccaceae bacterium]